MLVSDKFVVNKIYHLRGLKVMLDRDLAELYVSTYGYRCRYDGTLPYVFTEHGVLMLANVLRSGRSLKMSIRIIEIFVRLREMLTTHGQFIVKLFELESKVKNQDRNLKQIFGYLKQIIGQ